MRAAATMMLGLLCGCAGERDDAPQRDVHAWANGCYTVATRQQALTLDGSAVSWSAVGTPLRFQYSDLGTTLLYDPRGGFVVADGTALRRETTLESDRTRVDETYLSGAEWVLETHPGEPERFALRSRRTGGWLAEDGLVDAAEDAAAVLFEAATGCADFPELSLDATGAPARTTWDDGELYGFVDMHSHILTLTPRPNGPVCDEAYVDAQLDAWHARGVRVLFPTHKYDNAFAPGDGSSDFIEVGNFLNSGYYTNKVTDCPTDVESVFDKGDVRFGGLLAPRDVYQSTPDEDLSGLPNAPLDTVLPYAFLLLEGGVAGDHCQNGTLTPVGEHLLHGIMRRGMLPELDHLPRRAYKRAFELLAANDYPALGTHGNDNHDRLYALGGLASEFFGRCHNPDVPGGTFASFQARLDAKAAAGQHPSQGFGFDYNGFAHGPGPRFGPNGCATPQQNPVTYPFQSVDGGVTFTQPAIGERVLDFNTEGMVHIGLVAEYLQDARLDGVTEAQLEPLFRSAEGYLQLWERAEARGRALRGD